MVSDPYKSGKFKSNPYYEKSDVEGRLVVVLDGMMDNRALELITPISRCVCKYDIHELIFTDEQGKPGDIVNKIAYLGFLEIERGGVIIAGDIVELNGVVIGTLAGFDETHMPNHQNIVINSTGLISGKGLNVELGSTIKFKLSSRR